MTVVAPNVGVCDREARRFAAVLASPAASRVFQFNCAVTYPSSFSFLDSNPGRCGRSASLSEATTLRFSAKSLQVGLPSGFLTGPLPSSGWITAYSEVIRLCQSNVRIADNPTGTHKTGPSRSWNRALPRFHESRIHVDESVEPCRLHVSQVPVIGEGYFQNPAN
jgi:hypothetical protein